MDVRLLKLSGVDLNQSWEKVLEELQMKNISLLDRIGTSQDPVQREKLQILQGQIEALCEEIDQILSTAVSLDPQRANTAPRDDGARKQAEAKERAEAEARAAEEKKQAEARARAAAQAAAPAKAAQAAPKPAPPPAPKKPALSPEMEEAKAQFSMGQKLLSGRGVDKNPALAAELFRKAAEAGWLEAQYQLGRCCEDGVGVARDTAQAASWYRRAAERNHPGAQYRLGRCYEYMSGDPVQAAAWYRKAAELGSPEGQMALARCYENGIGVTRDAVQAEECYRKAAELGDPEAQYQMGSRLKERDATRAAEWYRKAAEQGHAEAQYQLGECYQNGTGVAKDPLQAVEWFRRAAELGHAAAQTGMGYCYSTGLGVLKDDGQAVFWYRKAAEQGYAVAQSNLGYCYLCGEGVAWDDGLAVEWLLKAAEQGHIRAQYLLGWYYENRWDPMTGVRQQIRQEYAGHPREQELIGIRSCLYIPSREMMKKPGGFISEKASEWYRKAAEQGDAESQYRLAMLTLEPRWLREAARQGHEDAQKELTGYYFDHWDETDGQAAAWFREMAEKGDNGGLEGLGRCYYTGRGVKRDYAQAVSLWSRSEQTRLETLLGLADCYEKGLGVPRNMARAVDCYQKAATKYPYKTEEIQCRLGFFYYEGQGVEKSYTQAVTWWKSAVKYTGHGKSASFPSYVQTAFYLGMCYEEGLGTEQSFREAADWYRAAAANNHAQAMFRLAGLYEEKRVRGVTYVGRFGKTSEDHLTRAAEWYRRAAELGVNGAQEALKRVEKKIRWRW